MYILGIWDGHDSGAALLEGERICFASNEERFTKRKLEVGFPTQSIRAALKSEGIRAQDIGHVALSTADLSKTAERVFPSMKESYYQFRRRKMDKPMFENLRHKVKYSMTGIGRLPGSAGISRRIVAGQLRHMGFDSFKLHIVDHHEAHAACAALTGPFVKSLVITIDGLGDGLSGSVSTFEKGVLERKAAIPARDSLGIFFEQVTNIMGMRELEDEGKVMAMADYSYPFSIKENRLEHFFRIEGSTIRARYSPTRQFSMLQRIAWRMPREQFAYMAQQLLEAALSKLAGNIIDRYGIGDVAFSGGIFSNVKANMMVRKLDALKHWYIFPHMGDGGLAMGAALKVDNELNGTGHHEYSAYLGSAYGESETEAALKRERWLRYSRDSSQEGHAAELICKGNYVLWFQGRMEYGPRALGNRSILAPPGSEPVKDRLNLHVKKREWFQPFAPSMMHEEAKRLLEYDEKGRDRYMTMAYGVRGEFVHDLKAVTHIDGSARVQMVEEENRPYRELIRSVKKGSGMGTVLNTSFNIHGMPIVMNPEDAIRTMRETKAKYMFINGFFVENRAGV